MAKVSEAIIDPDGGSVSIRIIIGKAQLGKYELTLIDPSDFSSTVEKRGNNADNIDDVLRISDPNRIIGKFLLASATIFDVADVEGDLYSVTLSVTQGSQVVHGGVVADAGELSGITAVSTGFSFKSKGG
jgi:hypothetical protein